MKRTIEVVYDPECPICDYHARNLELGKRDCRLRLVSARESGALMHEITAAGLDVDEGFVVRENGQLHHGSVAMHRLAHLNSRRGLSNRLVYLLFRNSRMAELLYPLLAGFRRLLLWLLRRRRIKNLSNQN